MPKNYSDFETPSFARREAYNFDTTKDSFEIYKELSQVAEELEQCRARNI